MRPEEMREHVEKTERLYSGRVVTLDLYEVTLPDGMTARREIVQHPGAVAIVAVDDADHVLLVRQYRTAADDILLELPAGTLEPGEDPAVCADRELQEEAGHKPGQLRAIGGIYAAPGYTTEYVHLFIATELKPSRLDADADEFIETVRLPLADALAMIDDGTIQDSKTVAGLLRAARLLNR
ncbi:MAG: NUDIX hydrolase [Chloroflexota bacterium]